MENTAVKASSKKKPAKTGKKPSSVKNGFLVQFKDKYTNGRWLTQLLGFNQRKQAERQAKWLQTNQLKDEFGQPFVRQTKVKTVNQNTHKGPESFVTLTR